MHFFFYGLAYKPESIALAEFFYYRQTGSPFNYFSSSHQLYSFFNGIFFSDPQRELKGTWYMYLATIFNTKDKKICDTFCRFDWVCIN